MINLLAVLVLCISIQLVISSINFDVSSTQLKSYLYRDSANVLEMNSLMLKEFTGDSIESKIPFYPNNPSLVLFYAPVSSACVSVDKAIVCCLLLKHNSGALIVDVLCRNSMLLLKNISIYLKFLILQNLPMLLISIQLIVCMKMKLVHILNYVPKIELRKLKVFTR